MPSLVTWSHQEIFSCSSSGHPSLWRWKEKRVATWFCFGKKSCFKPESRKFPFLEPMWVQMYTRTPHTHGECFCQTISGVKSSPEAVSGALKQNISRVKDHWFIPFWTPPSSYTRTDTLGFLDLNTTKPPSRKAKNRVDFCHAASNFPGVTLQLPVGVTLKCNL